MKEIKIKNKIIGKNQPIFIIAEMACGHDGSMEIAKQIIEEAAQSGADAINLPITSLPDYMVKDFSAGGVSEGKDKSDIYGYLEKLLWFKEKEWKELLELAREKGLIISIMCDDLASTKLAAKLNTDIFQIHSAALSEKDLVKECAKSQKPVCLKIGGTPLGELEETIRWIKEEGNDQIMLMHGFQSYPTKLEDVHLKFIPTLEKLFGFQIGFADHTDGGSDMALMVPLLALPFGITFLEKHITHDREKKCEDFESALNPNDFKKFISYVREAEKTFGKSLMREFSKDELEYRKVSKKRVVANEDIKKDETITENKIAFKRANNGLYAGEVGKIIGRVAKEEIKKDEPLILDKLV